MFVSLVARPRSRLRWILLLALSATLSLAETLCGTVGGTQTYAEVAFSGCTRLLGSLQIESVPGISAPTGLSSLQTIDGSLIIRWNSLLVSCTGLEGLTLVGQSIILDGNPLLTDISALGGVAGPVNGTLAVSNHLVLASLVGLGGISTAQSLEILGNKKLTSLTGLSLSSVLTTVAISGTGDPSSNLLLANICALCYSNFSGGYPADFLHNYAGLVPYSGVGAIADWIADGKPCAALVFCSGVSRTRSRTPSKTPSPSPSASLSASPSATSSDSPSFTPSATMAPTTSHSLGASASSTLSPSPSSSDSPSQTPSAVPTSSSSESPSQTPSTSLSRTPSVSPSSTPSSTSSWSPNPTASSSLSSSLSRSPAQSISPTSAGTASATLFATPTSEASASVGPASVGGPPPLGSPSATAIARQLINATALLVNQTVIISGPILITGNVSLANASVIVYIGEGPATGAPLVVVQGVLDLAGANLTLTPTSVGTFVVFEATGGILGTPNLAVDDSKLGLRKCERADVTTTKSADSRQMSALINIDDQQCRSHGDSLSPGGIAGISVAVGLVCCASILVAAAGIVVFGVLTKERRKRLRLALLPQKKFSLSADEAREQQELF